MDVRRSRHVLVVAVTAIGLASIAACGSTSSEGSSAGASTEAETSTGAVGPTSEQPGGEDGADTAGGDGGDASFCDLAGQLAEIDDFIGEVTTDSSPESALRTMQENYAKLTAHIAAMEASAPGEVAADLAIVAAAAERANERIQASQDYDELTTVMQEVFGVEEADAASERVDAFLQDECGLSFE